MYTREDFGREYGLNVEDVDETLKVCGLSAKKRNYSAPERERFAQARKMFDEGVANSYDDLAEYFKGQDLETPETATITPELAEHLRLLEQEAVETGFKMGLQHGEIMGKVIPQVAIMRLKEMIATGELKQNFERLWREASAGLGNEESMSELLQTRWRDYQLSKSPPLTSLPESSTESSDSDF